MKKRSKHIIIICVTILISTCLVYKINITPQYPNEMVLDIRNTTKQNVYGMSISVVVPDTYNEIDAKEYENNIVNIPELLPNERIIFVIKQNKLAGDGMKLQLNYHNYKDILTDEVHTNEKHGDIGSTYIINVDNQSFRINPIYNRLLQIKELFCFRRYSRIIEG